MKIPTLRFSLVAAFSYFLTFHPLSNATEQDASKAIEAMHPMAILQNMAKTIASAETLSVTLYSRHDALQTSGQMIEFGATRSIKIQRPDKMRMDLRQSDGDEHILTFNGQQISYYNVHENVYTTADKKGSVDEAIRYLVGTLKIPLPLARLFSTTLPAELDQLVNEIKLVEVNKQANEWTDHIIARTEDVDFQLWISRGKLPLPERVIITYKHAEGQPQYRADFAMWDISKTAIKQPLTFSIPKSAERIPLVVRHPTVNDAPILKGEKP